MRTTALVVLLALPACTGHPTAPDAAEGTFTLQADVGPSARGISIEVTAADIETPLAYNIPVANGVASGTIRVPAGGRRTFTARAFDFAAIETHRGSATVDVRPGENVELEIVLESLAGDVPITLDVATYQLTFDGTLGTLESGETAQLGVTVTDATGEAVVEPEITWASSNPVVASVGPDGLVTAGVPGAAEIAASFRSISIRIEVTVEAAPGATSKIAFQSDRDGNWDVWTMNPDGTGLFNATSNLAADTEPLYSPDGLRIVFKSDRDGGSHDLWVIQPDASLTRLTTTAAEEMDVAWSPDGTRVAFASQETGDWDVWVVAVDGTGLTNLTQTVLEDRFPHWSPDGSQITFQAIADDQREIFVMNADGSGRTRLTNNSVHDERPRWSPDGTQIVYRAEEFPGSAASDDWLIRTVSPAGALLDELTGIAEPVLRLRWSPDGAGILYTAVQDGLDIVHVDVASRDDTNLTAGGVVDAADDTAYDWSTDGSQIVFEQTAPDEGGEIVVMDADGSGQTNLTNDPADDRNPSWGGGS